MENEIITIEGKPNETYPAMALLDELRETRAHFIDQKLIRAIRAAMKSKGISEIELARLSAMNEATVRRILKNPARTTFVNLVMIADQLGASFSFNPPHDIQQTRSRNRKPSNLKKSKA